MEQFFVTYLTIKNIRHLKNISIPLSDGKIKHLILTGKNGSGKRALDFFFQDGNNIPF